MISWKFFRKVVGGKLDYAGSILLTLIIAVSCGEDSPGPGRFSRLEKQQWFIELQRPCAADDVCGTSIFKGDYLGQDVYFTQLVGAYCDPSFYAKLFDVNGNVVKIYDESNMVEFSKEVKILDNIWVCKVK